MPPTPPPEPELYDHWFDSLLRQHHVDVQRLWKRFPQFPQAFIGTMPGGEDAFGGTEDNETQFIRPISTIINPGGNWYDENSMFANIWQSVDEETPNDSDYIQNNGAGTQTIEFGLESASDPEVHSEHVVRVRFQGGPLTVVLVDVTTVIWSITYPFVEGSFRTEERTLMEAEASSITDYTDLRIRLSTTSGIPSGVLVSWVEVEIPG